MHDSQALPIESSPASAGVLHAESAPSGPTLSHLVSTGGVQTATGASLAPGGAISAQDLLEPPAFGGHGILQSALAWLASTRSLLVIDALVLVAAVLVFDAQVAASPYGVGAVVLLPVVALTALGLRGAYGHRLRASAVQTLERVLAAASLGVIAVLAERALAGSGSELSAAPVDLWLLAVGGLLLGRLAHHVFQVVARRRWLTGRRTIILGAGDVGARVCRRLLSTPGYGLLPVGFLDVDPPDPGAVGGRAVPVLGTPDQLAEVLRVQRAEHVVFSFPACPDSTLVSLVRRCAAMGVTVSLVPRLFDSISDRLTHEPLGGLPLMTVDVTDPDSWRFAVKHAFDRIASGILLLVLSPVVLAIALAVRVDSPGPILFRQRRVGRDGRPFEMLKFRTMRVRAGDSPSFVPPDGMAPGGVEGDDRRTRVGRRLRRTSLDELPQLFNVLRGEMSLVGPRPERPEYVDEFSAGHTRYLERHRVRGGVTGLSQVSGLRGRCSLADRVELDNYYIEHFSLALDLRILLMTLVAVVRSAE